MLLLLKQSLVQTAVLEFPHVVADHEHGAILLGVRSSDFFYPRNEECGSRLHLGWMQLEALQGLE